jgi:hypothetical protein
MSSSPRSKLAKWSPPWYSPITFCSSHTKSERHRKPPSSWEVTFVLRPGSGSPCRTNSRRLRDSIAESEPTRIHRSASPRATAPRGRRRAASASARGATESRRLATWSPTTTRSSTPSSSPRSTQVSAGAVTRSPWVEVVARFSRPRWGRTCGRSRRLRFECRITCRGIPCSRARGRGSPSRAAAVQCEKATSSGSTSAAPAASWLTSPNAVRSAALRRPCSGRARSAPRRRPSPRPALSASDTLKGRSAKPAGRVMRARATRESSPTARHTCCRHPQARDERVAVRPSGDPEPRTATLSTAMRKSVPPAGFEPALPPPEGGALSPELRGPTRAAISGAPREGSSLGWPPWNAGDAPAGGSWCATTPSRSGA